MTTCYDCSEHSQERDKFDFNSLADDLDYHKYEQGANLNIIVAGRLKTHIEFWRSIGANEFILNLIEEGYRIPFHSSPP